MFAPAAADHENIHGSGGSMIVQSIISARQRAKFRWRTQAKRKLSSVVIWFFEQGKIDVLEDKSNIHRLIPFPLDHSSGRWPAASLIESLLPLIPVANTPAFAISDNKKARR
jgi:hypothetical protein